MKTPLTYIDIAKKLYDCQLREKRDTQAQSIEWKKGEFKFHYDASNKRHSLLVEILHPTSMCGQGCNTYPEPLLIYRFKYGREFIEEGPWQVDLSYIFDGFSREIKEFHEKEDREVLEYEKEQARIYEDKLERFRKIYE